MYSVIDAFWSSLRLRLPVFHSRPAFAVVASHYLLPEALVNETERWRSLLRLIKQLVARPWTQPKVNGSMTLAVATLFSKVAASADTLTRTLRVSASGKISASRAL